MNELTIGESYIIKYSNIKYDQIFKLVEKHKPSLIGHEILYTFIDEKNGVKTKFTNSIINSGKFKIFKYEDKSSEEKLSEDSLEGFTLDNPEMIEIITNDEIKVKTENTDSSTKTNYDNEDFIKIMYPNQNKEFIDPIINNRKVKDNRKNVYHNINSYLSDTLEDHDIYN